MSDGQLTVEQVERATDEARRLIDALEAELALATEDRCQRHGYDIERVFQPDVCFYIVRIDGAAVGCGAIGLDDGFVELKRMYVQPEARGRGAVQVLLQRLEAEALARGFRHLMLETGDNLYAALKVYERAGYRRRGAFGPYLSMTPHAIARSVFMEKTVG